MHVYKVETLLQELVSSKIILFDFLSPPDSEQADISSCFNILQELSKHILGKIKNVDKLENVSKIIHKRSDVLADEEEQIKSDADLCSFSPNSVDTPDPDVTTFPQEYFESRLQEDFPVGIENSVHEENTKEYIYIKCGPGFGDRAGAVAIIVHALYGLTTSAEIF